MGGIVRGLIVGFVAFWPAASAAADLVAGGSARVIEIVDGDTVVLDNGEEVRLVGIQAPKLPLGRPNFHSWPLADEAKKTLSDFSSGRKVSLFYGSRQRDRYGRHLAHLYLDDGTWLQGKMIRLGFARVYGFRDNRALLAELLALEAQARAARRGIWTHAYYRVRPAEPPDFTRDRFELVEGRVVDVAIVRGHGYLNFGADWRHDFTASVAPKNLRLFEREGFDLKALKGRTVRVQGWIRSFNGPLIDVTHPEQIEVFP